MAKSPVPKPSHIDDAPRQNAERTAKAASLQIRYTATLTLEREALEHPHIHFNLQRDPMLVAMGVRGLNEPALRAPSRAGHGRGK